HCRGCIIDTTGVCSGCPTVAILVSLFFFYCSGHLRDLHSFPTRRSSDLLAAAFAPRRALPQSPNGDPNKSSSAAPSFGMETWTRDRKSTRLNSSHLGISYAVFCLKKKKNDGQHAASNGSRLLSRHLHHLL